ncbi:MAG TPA: TadE/TadG family type IV pilus assembly protein [Bryobacteraceae bacterium]|nr:TadE/TadG family type IV pilus assembly protein [Bryobacteraceae bacterium]
MKNLTKTRARQKGQSTVELALALLVFLPMIFGTMEFARLVYSHTWVQYVSREATRWASVRSSSTPTPATSSSVQTFVRSLAVAAIDPNQVSVTTTFTPNNNSGSTVRVQVQYPVPIVVHWVIPQSAVNVAGVSQMVIM